MNVIAIAHPRKSSPQQYYVDTFGIRGTRTDIKRWAALCGHVVKFVKEDK